jgi:hypothetical protein
LKANFNNQTLKRRKKYLKCPNLQEKSSQVCLCLRGIKPQYYNNILSLISCTRCRYNILDLQKERKFIVNLDLSVCVETDGGCLHDIVLFKDTAVPKILCNWDTEFSIPGKERLNVLQ